MMVATHKHGKLFVFEGPDGSGKSTLSLAFVEHLRSKGIECDHFAFPGQNAGTLGKLVHDLHHDPHMAGVESITPTSLQLLHIAAHIDAIDSRILPALRKGKSVVLDRFWWSTWVYGKVSGVNHNSLKAMIRSERIAWGKVCPATVFLIGRTVPNQTQNYEQLFAEYMNLASREARRNPVRYIKNEGTVAETLAEIVSNQNINEGASSSNGPIGNFNRDNQSQLSLDDTPNFAVAPLGFTRIAPAKPTVVFETYWRFAAERQAIFFRRLGGAPPPWTNDPVLLEYKFTNSYRASDRVSQYLMRHVIYEGKQSAEEIFFRIVLFKFFNRIETWELLRNELGTISFAEYSFERYDAILNRALSEKSPIYSAAYIMPSGGSSQVSNKKHQMHLRLLEQMMRNELPARLADASSMRKAFELLRSYPTIGDFLAYQYVTDLNYSTLINFSEMEFVVPGPGARDGIRKCFSDLGGLNESEIIKVVADRQQGEFDHLGLEFQSLWGRPLQLIDCQNVFCEVDKYARINHPDIMGITGRTRIKQRYRINRAPISVWYPPKWGLNERIASEDKYVSSV
jgi:thymidylate kinase